MAMAIRSRIQPPRGARPNPAHPLAGHLAGCWLLNEGAGQTAFDTSGHHHDGSFSGGPQWSLGQFGHEVEFDGNNDWISMGDCLALGADDITMLAIVRYSAESQPA